MNHDITHCSGEDILIQNDTSHRFICPKRNGCRRYQAYKQIPENTTVSMTFALECAKDNYNLYWENKE